MSHTADPSLRARFDGNAGQWRIAEGHLQGGARRNAEDFVLEAEVPRTEQLFGS